MAARLSGVEPFVFAPAVGAGLAGAVMARVFYRRMPVNASNSQLRMASSSV